MLQIFTVLQIVTVVVFLSVVYAQLHPSAPARYVRLPSLRDQAAILDNWRDERLENIPTLLNKYSIDAWLVSHSTNPWALSVTMLTTAS